MFCNSKQQKKEKLWFHHRIDIKSENVYRFISITIKVDDNKNEKDIRSEGRTRKCCSEKLLHIERWNERAFSFQSFIYWPKELKSQTKTSKQNINPMNNFSGNNKSSLFN